MGRGGWILLQPPPCLQPPPIAAGGWPAAAGQEMAPFQRAGGVIGHQPRQRPLVQLALQPLQPLPHRTGGWQRLAAAVVAGAPGDQQVAAGGEKGLQQHVAILVGGVGITEPPLPFHQVKARPISLAGKDAGVKAEQHDHPVGDGPHRFEGADRQAAAAMAEAAAVHRQGLVEHRRHHRRIQHQRTGGGGLLPAIDRRQQGGQFPGSLPAIAKQIGQQLPQALGPALDIAGDCQLPQPVAQPGEQMQPAAAEGQVEVGGQRGHRCLPFGQGQPGPLR